MLERGKIYRTAIEFTDTDGLVPQDHLLRKTDAAVDFSKIYEVAEPLYCAYNGRPSIDPRYAVQNGVNSVFVNN